MATDYSAKEDRIRLRCFFAGGEYATLWITRRLANQLVQHLMQMLRERADELLGHPQDWNVPVSDAPSETTCAQNQWLVAAIDVGALRGPIQLTFRDDIHAAQITLNLATLKRWLERLRALYHAAEWPLSV